ncbi:MAG: hypothetical protein HY981_04045 [Candidatus Magasanikbacteria bacterium]|nr:hypothetical protein [Candidatus Magasanikbacteria bacterium]
MARKKSAPQHKKTPAGNSGNDFPTMFFESVSANTKPIADSSRPQDPRAHAQGARTQRLIWMWSGVSIVMIVVFFTWVRSLNANGVLDARAWFKKDSLIQESRKSLKYYFEKQNQDRAEMNAIADSLVPPLQANNSALVADQITQLKNKITALSVSATSSAPTMLPSSPNKK